MDKWRMVNHLRNLIKDGKVAPLLCPDCNSEVVFLLAGDEEPVIWCYIEDTTFNPGVTFWSDVRAVVLEHVLEP